MERMDSADQQKILDAIAKKLPHEGAACPLCGNQNWTLLGGFIMFATQETPAVGSLMLGGPTAPSIGLICTNCGNTQFLNLLVLGLREMVDRAGAEAENSPFWKAQRAFEEEQQRKK